MMTIWKHQISLPVQLNWHLTDVFEVNLRKYATGAPWPICTTLRAYTNLKKDVLRIVADFKAFLKKK